MPRVSAGLLLYRLTGDGPGADGSTPPGGVEVLVVHPGGPLWKNNDDGAWSIPKGEVEEEGDPASTAEREFAEELGTPPPAGPRIELGEITQRGGKRVVAWAVAGDLDVDAVRSNTFALEWPPRSGRIQAFPEIDRAAWFAVAAARHKLVAAQTAFLDRLLAALGAEPESGPKA